jgi:hypothetical protein
MGYFITVSRVAQLIKMNFRNGMDFSSRFIICSAYPRIIKTFNFFEIAILIVLIDETLEILSSTIEI